MKRHLVAIILTAAIAVVLCSCQQQVKPGSSNVTTETINERGLDLNETPLMI